LATLAETRFHVAIASQCQKFYLCGFVVLDKQKLRKSIQLKRIVWISLKEWGIQGEWELNRAAQRKLI